MAGVIRTGPARAVIYVRQSIARDDSVSPELQRTACTDHCARTGTEVVDVVEDLGISGRTWKRPGVQQVMAMIEDGRADVIVLWKWSRLSRSRLDWAVATDRVERAGGRIESATEPIDVTTASGRLARGMLAEFAAFESERIGEQWKETHARRRRIGVPAQGGGRYGYTRDGDTYTPHPEQAGILVRMYEAFIGGQGSASIARDLNLAGHLNRLGRPWNRTTVRVLLDSGFAAGLLVSGRGANAAHEAGIHPALITPEQWAAYQRARTHRATIAPRVLEPRYPLTGLIRCGDCGYGMHSTHGGKRDPAGGWVNGHAYLCSGWKASGQGRCVTITRRNAEDGVLAWLRDLAAEVQDAEAADRARRVTQRAAVVDARVHARRVTELDRQLTELTRHLVAGVIPQDTYVTARDELTAERDTAHRHLVDAETAAHQAAPATAHLARELVSSWDTLSVRHRRDLLALLVREVTVYPPDQRHQAATVRIRAVWEPELV